MGGSVELRSSAGFSSLLSGGGGRLRRRQASLPSGGPRNRRDWPEISDGGPIAPAWCSGWCALAAARGPRPRRQLGGAGAPLRAASSGRASGCAGVAVGRWCAKRTYQWVRSTLSCVRPGRAFVAAAVGVGGRQPCACPTSPRFVPPPRRRLFSTVSS